MFKMDDQWFQHHLLNRLPFLYLCEMPLSYTKLLYVFGSSMFHGLYVYEPVPHVLISKTLQYIIFIIF